MQLSSIDKATYRSRLNKVIIAFIVMFAVLAIIFGQVLIMFLSDPQSDNFWLNFSGVILALVCSLSVINGHKNKPYMNEVFYVWQLKQQINMIYRKLKRIKDSAYQDGNIDALNALKFYYKACLQLYTLDDNTITLSSLQREQTTLNEYAQTHNLKLDEKKHHVANLSQF